MFICFSKGGRKFVFLWRRQVQLVIQGFRDLEKGILFFWSFVGSSCFWEVRLGKEGVSRLGWFQLYNLIIFQGWGRRLFKGQFQVFLFNFYSKRLKIFLVRKDRYTFFYQWRDFERQKIEREIFFDVVYNLVVVCLVVYFKVV